MRALILALALSAPALSAAAADVPLSGEQIRDLARRDMVWCENYRPSDKDCETMTLVSLLPDGSLRETGVMRLSSAPDLKMVVDGLSRIEGDRVCSEFGEQSVRLSFLLNDQPVSGAAAEPLKLLVREAMAEFEGKTLCQTFYRGATEAEVRERITVDGQRREDLESVYRLQKDEAGLDIRPAADEGEESVV